jgi:hypothetical protein
MKQFSGVTGFDFHRIGPHDERRRCMTADELMAKGYIERGGIWRRDVARPEHWNVATVEVEE